MSSLELYVSNSSGVFPIWKDASRQHIQDRFTFLSDRVSPSPAWKSGALGN